MIGEDNWQGAAARATSERKFGIAVAGVLALLGALPLLQGEPARPVLLFASAALMALALIAPRLLSLPNRGFARLGQLLQKIVSPVILLILFGLVITPMALLWRLGRRHSRSPAETSGSLWTPRELPITQEFFRRQY